MFFKSNLVKQYLLIIFIYLFVTSCKNSVDFNLQLKKGENYTFASDPNELITGSIIIKDSIDKIRIAGSLKDGMIHGKWLEYFSNGQLKHDRNYLNERFQGINKEYYVNGQLKWIGKYELGEKIGLHKSWYENGKLKSEIYYVNGDIEGLWKQWDKKGALISGIYVEEKIGFFKRIFNF